MHAAAADFEQRGFVVVREAVRPAAVAEIVQRLDDFIANELPRLPSEVAFYHGLGRTGLWHVHALAQQAYFRELPLALGWQPLAEHLLDAPSVPNVPQLIDKPPGTWHVVPPHQDCAHARRHGFVTFWLALDDSTAANGCLRFVAGSHRRGCRRHRSCSDPGFALALADHGDDDRAREVAVPCASGDLSIHHSDAIHSSGANTTRAHRRALVTVFSRKVNES